MERRRTVGLRLLAIIVMSPNADEKCAGPLQQPPPDRFANFDDDANHLMSSLHLDAEEEPRSRGLGATSRANSVRFDESANQNHFSHSSRPSVELFSRTNSGLGGLQMTERTFSHKSEGRASSVHSMRSAASGRASSLNLDTAAYGMDSVRSPLDLPGLAPGLLLLGAVPAVIRCWMNTNFKHDALLYAAVCTGSYKSFLDLRLIRKLGFENVIAVSGDGYRTVDLPIYFPEAVPHPASSRSNSPAPQLPSLRVEFRVIEHEDRDDKDMAIQIFIGSDVLRAHNADILFSSNSMTLYDDERNKLSIPLSRPENAAAFNTLYVTSGSNPSGNVSTKGQDTRERPTYLNGLGGESSTASGSSAAASPPLSKYRPPGALAAESGATDTTRSVGIIGSDSNGRSTTSLRPSLAMLNTRADSDETSSEAGAPMSTAAAKAAVTPAIWSSWRRDGTGTTTATTTSASSSPSAGLLDWANAGKNRDVAYQRKDTGIKVLKPKTAVRSFSTTSAVAAAAGGAGAAAAAATGGTPVAGGAASPATSSSSTTATPAGEGTARSRFFDDGRRISGGASGSGSGSGGSGNGNGNGSTSEKITAANTKENAGLSLTATAGGAAGGAGVAGVAGSNAPVKMKANPIGGASAFSWLGK